MKRQWALTTISIDDLNQPSFQVQIQPPTITYNKNTKSQQDLVVKTISPEVNPIKVLDLSKSTPILPINTSTNKQLNDISLSSSSPSPKQLSPIQLSPSDNKNNKSYTRKMTKRSLASLPSQYLSEFFPLIKSEPIAQIDKTKQYTIKLEYVPPISRQMSRRTQRRLNSLPKRHTKIHRNKKDRMKIRLKNKINKMMQNELKPLKFQLNAQNRKRQEIFFKIFKIIKAAKSIIKVMVNRKANDFMTLQREKAASTIQNSWRKHKNLILGRLVRKFNKNHLFLALMLRTNLRTSLRTRKAHIVRWFIGSFTHFTKVNVAVKMYRYRVVKAQSYIRSWLKVKTARLVALLRKFSSLEYKYRYKFRSIMQKVYAKMKIREQNDVSLLTVARKNLGNAKKKCGNAKLGKKKIKKGSVLMKALKEDIAPTLQCIRETLGNNSLVHDAAAMTAAVAMNPSSVSRDGNPIERKKSTTNSNEQETQKEKRRKARKKTIPALKRMSRERIKEFSGNSAGGLNFGSAVPLKTRIKILEKQLRKARIFYVRQGATNEMKQFASGRFDRSDLKRLLEYDLSFGQLLDSKKQAQGLFKPYTMNFFSNKEFYKLIEKSLQETARSQYYEET